MNRLGIGIILSFLFLQGCNIHAILSGTASPKENAESMLKTGYYKDLLWFRTRQSGSSCVNKWNQSDIVRYNLPNRNFVYVEASSCGCKMHWEIDKKTEKIVAYTSKGKTCYKLDLVQMPKWKRLEQ